MIISGYILRFVVYITLAAGGSQMRRVGSFL